MSISDKLTAIAANEQKVFEAGKRALLKASKHLNATVSGEVIAVNDVSPVEHDVAVRLSSDTVTDFSQVNVSRYGKNLLDNSTDKIEEYTIVTSSGAVKDTSGYRILLPAGTYTLHVEARVGSFNDYIYHIVNTTDGRAVAIDGNGTFKHPVVGTLLNSVTFTIDVPFYYCIYNASGSPSTTSTHLAVTKEKFSKFNFQVEVGDTATPYEPYIEPTTCTANADGTVEDVRSLSPSMTLTTDTDGVTIACSYLRDIDAYIDGLGGV